MSEKTSLRYTRGLVLFLLCLVLTSTLSCLEVHMSLLIRGDGSGRGKIKYVIARGMYQAPDEEKLAINEDKLAEQLAKKEGVKVIRTGSQYRDENMIEVWGDFEFKDITKLSDKYTKYVFTNLGGNKKEIRINYRITGELHRRDILKSMFRGLISTVEIEVAGKVISTNGKRVSKRKVRWEIVAEDVVGRDITEDMILIFEAEGKNLLQRIKDKLKI